MKKIYLIIVTACLFSSFTQAQEHIVTLTLKEAILLARLQSVDAAVALNELKMAYQDVPVKTPLFRKYP